LLRVEENKFVGQLHERDHSLPLKGSQGLLGDSKCDACLRWRPIFGLSHRCVS
jgi:hypothetical protein